MFSAIAERLYIFHRCCLISKQLNFLHKISLKNIQVIRSIHQPSSSLKFVKLFLKDGRCSVFLLFKDDLLFRLTGQKILSPDTKLYQLKFKAVPIPYGTGSWINDSRLPVSPWNYHTAPLNSCQSSHKTDKMVKIYTSASQFIHFCAKSSWIWHYASLKTLL